MTPVAEAIKALETTPGTEAVTALTLETVKALMTKPGVVGTFVVILTNGDGGEPQFAFGGDLDGADFDTLAGCAVEGLGALRQTFK